jgi:hypothetical protein
MCNPVIDIDFIQGVVSRVTPTRVEIVASADDVDDDLIEAWGEAGGPMLRLDMLASEATHRKMMEALEALERCRDGPALRLVDLLFGRVTRPPPVLTPEARNAKAVSADLNEQQRAAVALGLATDDVALIHGPPGPSAARIGQLTPVRLMFSPLVCPHLHASSRRLTTVTSVPPSGTGKTTVVVELILQAVARGMRLLVCAPSNVAVDNIVGA